MHTSEVENCSWDNALPNVMSNLEVWCEQCLGVVIQLSLWVIGHYNHTIKKY